MKSVYQQWYKDFSIYLLYTPRQQINMQQLWYLFAKSIFMFFYISNVSPLSIHSGKQTGVFINDKSLNRAFIKNSDLPVCTNCLFYRQVCSKSNKNSDEINSSSKCSLFGTKDIVTGEITLETAGACRTDETKCGFNGTHYKFNDSLMNSCSL